MSNDTNQWGAEIGIFNGHLHYSNSSSVSKISNFSLYEILIIGYIVWLMLLPNLALCFPQFYEFHFTLLSEPFSSSVFLNAKIGHSMSTQQGVPR